MPMKKKRMKPVYRQGGGGIMGLAGTAGSSLEQATQAIMEATNAITGSGGNGGGILPGLPPGIGRPTFPTPQPQPGLPGLRDIIGKRPSLGGGIGIYTSPKH